VWQPCSELLQRLVGREVEQRVSSPRRLSWEEKSKMDTLRRLRNVWIPGVATIVLGSFSNAFAQQSYKITDLGVNNSKDNFSMAMGLNNQGWAENMDGTVNPPENSLFTSVSRGRAVISIYGFNIDLGTLGKPGANSWINWGGINDRGEAVGMSETAVLDPNGEDICGFGTFLTCVPFLWRDGQMSALPTVGGNNGQASAINNRGEAVGFAETADADPTCPPSPAEVPVLWDKGQAHALPLVGTDPDGFAFGINDRGEAVGYSGNCFFATHAVVWKNNTAVVLQDLGGTKSNVAYVINNLGQIAGKVRSADGTTYVAALWQPDGTLTNLGILPGDFAAFATGINDRGQVVGNNFDSNFNWSHGFLWQNDVMTDLNALIPEDSGLFIISASNINERGQISGMATVQTGPHAGDIHAFLLTPVDGRIGASMADFARTHPQSILHGNACSHFLQRLGPDRSER
jgi:probable HAF family extracellular repeat protein